MTKEPRTALGKRLKEIQDRPGYKAMPDEAPTSKKHVYVSQGFLHGDGAVRNATVPEQSLSDEIERLQRDLKAEREKYWNLRSPAYDALVALDEGVASGRLPGDQKRIVDRLYFALNGETQQQTTDRQVRASKVAKKTLYWRALAQIAAGPPLTLPNDEVAAWAVGIAGEALGNPPLGLIHDETSGDLLEIAREVSTMDCYYTGERCDPGCKCIVARASQAILPRPAEETTESRLISTAPNGSPGLTGLPLPSDQSYPCDLCGAPNKVGHILSGAEIDEHGTMDRPTEKYAEGQS